MVSVPGLMSRWTTFNLRYEQSGTKTVKTSLLCVMCSVQVVAGMLYKFDLVLRHENTGGCSKDDGEGERCHVEVHDVPWLQRRELAQTNCSRD